MAIESRQPKVNLLPPDLDAKLLDQYMLYFPTKVPEYGVVYCTFRKKQRRFMRFSQLSRFCDGTLLYVYNGLKNRLLEDKMPKIKNNQGKQRIIVAMCLIEDKLKERLMLRRVESAMKIRVRTIKDWDEYPHLSEWEPVLKYPPPY